MTYILDENRNVVECIDYIEWAKWMAKKDRRVKLTWLVDVEISTVFLGLGFSFLECEPKLFETMVFGGVKNHYSKKYRTWGEAEDGHEGIVEMVKQDYTYIMVGKKQEE